MANEERRQWTFDELVLAIRPELKRFGQSSVTPNFKLLRMTVDVIDDAVGRNNRNLLLSLVFGRDIRSSKDLTDSEGMAVLLWGGVSKDEPTGKWLYKGKFIHQVQCLRQALGQLPLDLEGKDISVEA